MAASDDTRGRRDDEDPDVTPGEYSSSPCYMHEFEADYFERDKPGSMAWADVRAWRRGQRRRLRDMRRNMSDMKRARADQAIVKAIDGARIIRSTATGIYWPLQGEFDSRPLMEKVLDLGGTVAIPVIVADGEALEFWRWDGRSEMHPRGTWQILAPVDRFILEPAVLFIPLLGFDADGHRLGNGGGYFDRTLANLRPRPVTIGIGYELGRLDTIYPQAHDIPLDAIVTETGVCRYDR